MIFKNYQAGVYCDEYFDESGNPREHCIEIIKTLNQMKPLALQKMRQSIDIALHRAGITFNVTDHKDGTEKIFPFDLIPRVINFNEWGYLEKGLKQRIQALDLFVADVYGSQHILKNNIVPAELVLSSKNYFPECVDLNPVMNRWIHISGIDIIKDENGQYYVLEDNCRCPSGVSYVLENRAIMKQSLPSIFSKHNIQSVADYPEKLLGMLHSLAPNVEHPNIVVLTPGIYNSAYFEHSYLARQMGVQLVEGRDLFVDDDIVYLKTTSGLEKIDVVYRRIDDDFLDPSIFNKQSLLGVKNIFSAYKKGNVAIANAPGTGVADDKAIYSYVPKIIKYYLGENPIIPNVPTYLMSDPVKLQETIDNIDDMVVKQTNSSGGYGVFVGPHGNNKTREMIKDKLLSDPRGYVSQPIIKLSRTPILMKDKTEARHVDFRPYILYGDDLYVLPGGLTRVALKKDSLVVNSSQGGGSKDTWVLRG